MESKCSIQILYHSDQRGNSYDPINLCRPNEFNKLKAIREF